tara:strand:- start:5508 stop:5744 length:237 start_codon:yes stop_codon:yes gene_type:complete
MPFWFLIQLVIGVVLMVVAYAILPKPKKQKPPESADLDDPTAEAGRPIPVVFGSLEVKGGNILWFGDKGKKDYEIVQS